MIDYGILPNPFQIVGYPKSLLRDKSLHSGSEQEPGNGPSQYTLPTLSQITGAHEVYLIVAHMYRKKTKEIYAWENTPSPRKLPSKA